MFEPKATASHLDSTLIPHFCEKRPDFAPIHARAETVAENEWFSDAYRKRRCVVPMNSFFQKNSSGKRYAISRPGTVWRRRHLGELA
jgi:putative SOS response-associated peptidase YedK